jgi:tRNA G10  N-methylase Trm11
MVKYFFLLGSTTQLCWAELEAVLPRFSLPLPTQANPFWAQIEVEEALQDEQLIALQTTLGGTVKIIRIWDESPLHEVSEVYERVLALLEKDKPKRFAIAEFGRDHLPPIEVIGLKEDLRKRGIKSNYAETSRHGANAAQLIRGVEEVMVIQFESSIFYGWTETVQNVDDWAKRDVRKPVRDRERGMLQPKVARMMLNIALADGKPEEAIVLDPFSGTGTVLMEAAELGVPVVYAADFSEEAVLASSQNLKWWQQQSKHSFEYELVRREVSHLTPRDFKQPITHIVTEPFLGKLKPAPDQIPNIKRGLEKLYRGMIKGFTTLLKPGARIVIILPAWEVKGQISYVDQTLADFEQAGFVIESDPLRAGRLDAITKRYVYVLEYKPYVAR